ncbi:hypothetical protein STEG23_013684, partial [Scotinomys teguina]
EIQERESRTEILENVHFGKERSKNIVNFADKSSSYNWNRFVLSRRRRALSLLQSWGSTYQ